MTVLKAFVCLIVVSELVFSGIASAETGSGNVSGNFKINSVEPNGSSEYTIDYDYPKEVVTGSNLTVTVTLEINSLRGLKLFLTDYRIDVFVSIPRKLVAHGQNLGGERYLYEGAHWGPRKIVMPINASGAGVMPGQTIAANISIGFLANVWLDYPISYYSPDSGTEAVGNVVISNRSSSPPLPYFVPVLVALGLALLGVYFLKSRQFFDRWRHSILSGQDTVSGSSAENRHDGPSGGRSRPLLAFQT